MILELIELAINNALEHDPKTQQQLLKLQGKSMVLSLKPIEQSLQITPCPEGVEFSREISESVDVTLTATLSAMIKISRDGFEDAELQAGELEIAGDPIIGQRFARIIAELNIDWEALLAEHIGDSPARLISIVASRARELANESRSVMKARLNSLIKDELKLTADKNDVETFLDSVDILRADTDRLANKIRRLQSKI